MNVEEPNHAKPNVSETMKCDGIDVFNDNPTQSKANSHFKTLLINTEIIKD